MIYDWRYTVFNSCTWLNVQSLLVTRDWIYTVFTSETWLKIYSFYQWHMIEDIQSFTSDIRLNVQSLPVTPDYVNPACRVVTVCHQVRCMYLGHLSHFHRAISHLKWYKIVCMRYLACTFSQMKSVNMFSLFLQSGVPGHFLLRFIVVWLYNITVFMFVYINVDLKL